MRKNDKKKKVPGNTIFAEQSTVGSVEMFGHYVVASQRGSQILHLVLFEWLSGAHFAQIQLLGMVFSLSMVELVQCKF